MGVPSCPRCWAVVALADPYCNACGLPLDQLREAAARAEFLGVWTVPGPGVVHPYRPVRGPAIALRALLVGLLLSAVATALAGVAAWQGSGPALVPIGPDLDLTTWAARAELAVLVFAVVLMPTFVWWFARAYRNLSVLGVRGLRHAPAWAVGAWFVPLVNLVVPKELVDDLFRGSDPDVALLSTGWRHQSVSWRVHAWWFALLAAIALLATSQWALGTGDPRFGLTVVVVAAVVVATSALLGVVLVGEITARQAARAEGLGPIRRPGHPVPEPSLRYRTALEAHADGFSVDDPSSVVVELR